MPRWLSLSIATVTATNRFIFRVTSALMGIVVPVMMYEVVARYLFNAPTVWAMELAVMLFGPYFLLGGPYLLHLRGHVALDVLRQRLSERWNRRLDLINYPVIMAFCTILLFYSVPAAFSSWQYRETSFSAWNPPIWPLKVVVPVALLMMLLQALAGWVQLIYRETPASAPTDGAAA